MLYFVLNFGLQVLEDSIGAVNGVMFEADVRVVWRGVCLE